MVEEGRPASIWRSKLPAVKGVCEAKKTLIYDHIDNCLEAAAKRTRLINPCGDHRIQAISKTSSQAAERAKSSAGTREALCIVALPPACPWRLRPGSVAVVCRMRCRPGAWSPAPLKPSRVQPNHGLPSGIRLRAPGSSALPSARSRRRTSTWRMCGRRLARRISSPGRSFHTRPHARVSVKLSATVAELAEEDRGPGRQGRFFVYSSKAAGCRAKS